MAHRSIHLNKPPPSRDLKGSSAVASGPISPRSAEAALFNEILDNCPPSSQAPLSWFVLDLIQLTKDPMAQNLNEVFSFDKNLGYMAHLLQSVPIIQRDEESMFSRSFDAFNCPSGRLRRAAIVVMDYVDALAEPSEDRGESKTSGEFESLKLLMEFVATLGFSMTSAAQMELFIAKVLELFDKKEYSFVIGLLFALASYERAVMGFLSRLVGFAKKSRQLVESLFNYGIASVTSVFGKIKRARTQEAAEPLIAQFDSLISQVRIVVRVASAEGPEGVRKSGIVEPIRFNAERIRNCLSDILSGEDFSLSIAASFFSLITTIADAMSPLSQDTLFAEKIVTDQHLENLMNALTIVGIVTKPPISIEDLTKSASNLWNWQIIMIFKDREGNAIAKPETIPKPQSRQREELTDLDPWARSKKTAKTPSRSHGANTSIHAEWQTRISQHVIKSGSGSLRWGSITPFMLSFIDLFRALATSRSKVWTSVLGRGHVVGHFARLAVRISNDVISNSIISSLYKMLDKGLSELIDQQSLEFLPKAILVSLNGQGAEDKGTVAIQQARMIRLLALLKIEIKSPSKPVQAILQNVLSSAPAVAKIIPSWQEQGKTDGVSAAKMHEPDYETGGRPSTKPQAVSSAVSPQPSSAASSEIVNRLIAVVKVKLAKASTMPPGPEKEALFAECHAATQQIQAYQQSKGDQSISFQSISLSKEPSPPTAPQQQQLQPAQSSSPQSTIQELTQDIQFRSSRFQQVSAAISAQSQQLEREIAALSDADRLANQALISNRRQEVEIVRRQLQEEEMIIKERERALLQVQQQIQPQQTSEQRSAMANGFQASVLQQGVMSPSVMTAGFASAGPQSQLQQGVPMPRAQQTAFSNGGNQLDSSVSAFSAGNAQQNSSQPPYASLSQLTNAVAQLNAGTMQQGSSQLPYAPASQFMNSAPLPQQNVSHSPYASLSQLTNASSQLGAANMNQGASQMPYASVSQLMSAPQPSQNGFAGQSSLMMGNSSMMSSSLLGPGNLQGNTGQGMNPMVQQQQPRLM